MVRPGNKRLRVAQNTNHGAGVNKDGNLPSIGRPISILKVTNDCHLCPYNYIFRKIFFKGSEFWDNGLEIKVRGVNKGNGTGNDDAGNPIGARLEPIANANTDVNVFSYSGTGNNLNNRSVMIEFYNRLHSNFTIVDAILTQVGTNRTKLEVGGINNFENLQTTDPFVNRNSASLLIWVQRQLYNFIWKKTFLRRWQLKTKDQIFDSPVYNKDLKFNDIKLTNSVVTTPTKAIIGGNAVNNYNYITKATIDFKMSVKIAEEENNNFDKLFGNGVDANIKIVETNKPGYSRLDGAMRRQISNNFKALMGHDGNLGNSNGYDNWNVTLRYIMKAIFKTGIDSVTTNAQKTILKNEFKTYITNLITEEHKKLPYTHTTAQSDFVPQKFTGAGTENQFGVFNDNSYGLTSENKIVSMISLFVNIYTDKLWVIENNAANGGTNGEEDPTFIASGGNTITTANKFYTLYSIISTVGKYDRNIQNETTEIKDDYLSRITPMSGYVSFSGIKNSLYMKLKRAGDSQAKPAVVQKREKLESQRIQNTVKNFNIINKRNVTRNFSNMNTININGNRVIEGAMINIQKDGLYSIDEFDKPIHIKKYNSLEEYNQNDILARADNFVKDLLMYDLNGDEQKSFTSDSIQSDLGVLYLALLNKDDSTFINREPKPTYILDSDGITHPDSIIYQKTKTKLLLLRDEMFKTKYTAYASITGSDKKEYTMTLYICQGQNNKWHIKAGGDTKSRLKYIHIELVDNMTRNNIDLTKIKYEMNKDIKTDLYYETKTANSSSVVFWNGLYTMGQDQTPQNIASFEYNGRGTPVFTINSKIIFQYTMNPKAAIPIYLDATKPKTNWLENYPVDTLYNDFTIRTEEFTEITEQWCNDTCSKFYFGNFSNVNEKGSKESTPTVNMNDFNEALLFSEIEIKRQQSIREVRNKKLLVELLTKFMTEHAKIAAAGKISFPYVQTDSFNFSNDVVTFDTSQNVLSTIVGIPKSQWQEHKGLITRNPHPKFPDEVMSLMKVVSDGIGVGAAQDNKNFHLTVHEKYPGVDKYIEDEDYSYSEHNHKIEPGIKVSPPDLTPPSFWAGPPNNVQNKSALDFYKAGGESITEYKTVVILIRPNYDISDNLINDFTEITVDYFPKGDTYHHYKNKTVLFNSYNTQFSSDVKAMEETLNNQADPGYCNLSLVAAANTLINKINSTFKDEEDKMNDELKKAISKMDMAQINKNSIHCEILKDWQKKFNELHMEKLNLNFWKIDTQLNTKINKLILSIPPLNDKSWENMNTDLKDLLSAAAVDGYPAQDNLYTILEGVKKKLDARLQTLLGSQTDAADLDVSLNAMRETYGTPKLTIKTELSGEYDASLNNTYLIINKLGASLESTNAQQKIIFQNTIKNLNDNIEYVNKKKKEFTLSNDLNNKVNTFIADTTTFINLIAIDDYIKENDALEKNSLNKVPSNNLHLIKDIPGINITNLTKHAETRAKNKKIEIVIDSFDSELNKLELQTKAGSGNGNTITTTKAALPNEPLGNDNYPLTSIWEARPISTNYDLIGSDLEKAIGYKNEIKINLDKLNNTLRVGGNIIKGTIDYNFEKYNDILDTKTLTTDLPGWNNAINDYGQVLTFFKLMNHTKNVQDNKLTPTKNKEEFDKIREQITLYKVNDVSADIPRLMDKVEVLSYAQNLDNFGNNISEVLTTKNFTVTELNPIKALDAFNHDNLAWRSDYKGTTGDNVLNIKLDVSLNELIQTYNDFYGRIVTSIKDKAKTLTGLYHLEQDSGTTYETLPIRFQYLNEAKLLRKLIQYLKVHNVLKEHEANHLTATNVDDYKSGIENTLKTEYDKAIVYDLDSSTANSDKTGKLKELVDDAEMQIKLKKDWGTINKLGTPITPQSKYIEVGRLLNTYKSYKSGLWNPSDGKFTLMSDSSNNDIHWNVRRVKDIQIKINKHKNNVAKNGKITQAKTSIDIYEANLTKLKNKFTLDPISSMIKVTELTDNGGTVSSVWTLGDPDSFPTLTKLEGANGREGWNKEFNDVKRNYERLLSNEATVNLYYDKWDETPNKFGAGSNEQTSTFAYDMDKIKEGQAIIKNWTTIFAKFKAEHEKIAAEAAVAKAAAEKDTEEAKKKAAAQKDVDDAKKVVTDRETTIVGIKTNITKLETTAKTVPLLASKVVTQPLIDAFIKVATDNHTSAKNILDVIDDSGSDYSLAKTTMDNQITNNASISTNLAAKKKEKEDKEAEKTTEEGKTAGLETQIENDEATVASNQATLTKATNAATNVTAQSISEKQSTVNQAQETVDNWDGPNNDDKAAADLLLLNAQQALQADLDLSGAKATAQINLNAANAVLLVSEAAKATNATTIATINTAITIIEGEITTLNTNKSTSNGLLATVTANFTTEKVKRDSAVAIKTNRKNELDEAERQKETAGALLTQINSAKSDLTTEEAGLVADKKALLSAQAAFTPFIPDPVPVPAISQPITVVLPLDLNKTLTANISDNLKGKIQRRYKTTIFAAPSGKTIKEIVLSETKHLGIEQNPTNTWVDVDGNDHIENKSAVDFATNLKGANGSTWYNVLNKENVMGPSPLTGVVEAQKKIADTQSTINDWVTISIEQISNKEKSAKLYIEINPTYPASKSSDADFPINAGQVSANRFGIDDLKIKFANNFSLTVKDDGMFNFADQTLTLATPTNTFNPKGWWTKNDTNIIGKDGNKIEIGTLKFGQLRDALSFGNAFEQVKVECGGNASGLRYIIDYVDSGFSNRLFIPKYHIRELNFNLLKNRGMLETNAELTNILGDYDGDGNKVTLRDNEEFFAAITFNVPNKDMITYLANPTMDKTIYNNIVKVLGIKQRRLFLTPFMEDGKISKNKDGSLKLKVHPDCLYGQELDRALKDIIPDEIEEKWTEIDRLEFAVPENIKKGKEKVYFIMQKSNLPEEAPNNIRIFVSGGDKELIERNTDGKIINSGFEDTRPFYGAQFYLNKKIKEHTFLFKESLSVDEDSSIKEINDTGKFGDKLGIDETSLAFVKFKNNIGYNFAGILGVFQVENIDDVDKLSFLKEKSIATFRNNDLTEAAPSFGKVYPIGAKKRYSLENGFVDLIVTDSHHAAVILNNNNRTTSFELNIYDEKERGARLGQCTLTGDKDEDLREVQRITNNKELIDPEFLPSTSVLKEDLNDNPNGGFRMIATCLKDDISFSKSVYCGIIRISSASSKISPDISNLKITSSNV